jgi:hypothetical protein
MLTTPKASTNRNGANRLGPSSPAMIPARRDRRWATGRVSSSAPEADCRYEEAAEMLAAQDGGPLEVAQRLQRRASAGKARTASHHGRRSLLHPGHFHAKARIGRLNERADRALLDLETVRRGHTQPPSHLRCEVEAISPGGSPATAVRELHRGLGRHASRCFAMTVDAASSPRVTTRTSSVGGPGSAIVDGAPTAQASSGRACCAQPDWAVGRLDSAPLPRLR